jgi:sugar lactone lactonase YvrE/mono/diheme cytochrome c family protein
MSKRMALVGALAAGAVVLVAGELWAQDAARSVWDGVYTEVQAERGAEAYAQNCGKCHGQGLTGLAEAKPLTGPEFMSNWNGLSLGALYDRSRTTMPLDKPRSLSRETYADILAYILKFDGFPAGKAELDKRSEVLAGISFDAFKPTASRGDVILAAFAADQAATPAVGNEPQPNPYTTDSGFLKMPPGRTMGSSSGVAVDSRGHIWVAERCGANTCAGSPLDPILEFDAKGTFLKAFGGGMLLFPHGLYVDAHDHVWVTDGHSDGTKGAQVFEFDATGKLLRALGKAGVSQEGPDTFAEPNAVVTTRDGTIFVADGHTPNKGAARIVKLDPKGRFLKSWGGHGTAPGQMDVPHTLALDSKGRLFVGDRWNNRIQIFDQDGKLLEVWDQFSRPSGLYIDREDTLYVADSESRAPEGYGHHPGWRRGIRIGSARTGEVTVFIPDTEPNPDKAATSGAEGVWADSHGVVYGAQVQQKAIVRYTRPRVR